MADDKKIMVDGEEYSKSDIAGMDDDERDHLLARVRAKNLDNQEELDFFGDEGKSDDGEDNPYPEWTVDELKDELSSRGLEVGGKKDELIARLEESDK